MGRVVLIECDRTHCPSVARAIVNKRTETPSDALQRLIREAKDAGWVFGLHRETRPHENPLIHSHEFEVETILCPLCSREQKLKEAEANETPIV